MMLIVASVAVVDPLRTSLLRAMGRFLVATDELRPADVIVLDVDSDGAGVLAATDLVHEHVADRVAVFGDPPVALDREFQRRGIPYHDAAAISVKQLHALGIDLVEVIPRTVTDANDESRILPAWCSEHRYGNVLLVSTAERSRRTARIVRRAMSGHDLIISVHASRYSDFDPDNWWKSRTSVRKEIIESEKLLTDILLHPFQALPGLPARTAEPNGTGN
jgi:hypothetical protein